MQSDIFRFKSYKAYLKAVEQEDPRGGRGFRSRLAKILRCNIAYVSQVMNKSGQFSLEQAEEINSYLGHRPDEADFFLLLVQLERAGSTKLTARLKSQLERKSADRLQLRNRVDIHEVIPESHQVQYYSSWHYAAIHVALSIPGLQDPHSIGNALNLSRARVSEILEFLTQVGLAIRDGARFKIGKSRVFLKGDSPMIWKHHTNWRMKAIESYDHTPSDNLHLSTVFTASPSETLIMKEEILRCIESVRARIKTAKDEHVQCFNLDFFAL